MDNILLEQYNKRYDEVFCVNDIPKDQYVVYILTFNDKPIVLGHGKRNRAKVIFDDSNTTTIHVKSLIVKLYLLYGVGEFKRYIIKCDNKNEASEIETKLHKNIGGNSLKIPTYIKDKLFNGLDKSDNIFKFLSIALLSSYDGISDLKKWKKEDIISDADWLEIIKRINLKY